MSARLSPSSPKQTVISGYDACGTRYNAARAHDPSPELDRLLKVLPEHARVLDIGCGGGLPITAALSRRANVVAVDISSVRELRFDVLASGVLDPGDRDIPGLPTDRHPVVFARLRPS